MVVENDVKKALNCKLHFAKCGLFVVTLLSVHSSARTRVIYGAVFQDT